jgi:carboxyl-terminal processing protease
VTPHGRRWVHRVATALLATGVLALGAIGARHQLDNAELLDKVFQLIKTADVDSFPDSTLYIKAARGLVHELNDPYAELYSPQEWAEFTRDALGNDYAGLGLGIESLSDSVTVTTVFPRSPAALFGVRRGDRIIAVAGASVVGMTTDQVSNRLMGIAGTRVQITLARAGSATPVIADIPRAVVHVPSVPYALMFGRVGYVPLLRVNESTAEEVRDALQRLHDEGATSYVLDLRGNPGGQLDQALDASSLFLDRGKVLASVRSREAQPEVYTARQAPVERSAPIVVLEDGYTASAAEIIAGALQDHDRALVLGMPSFGKGLVQTTIPLESGWLLKMTTGRWFTPSGRSIHRDRPFANGNFLDVDSAPLGRTAAAVRAGRPTVHSDDGRILYGGGGIVPDVVVPMDTLSTAEQHFVESLEGHGATASAVMYSLARRLALSATPTFTVQPDWVATYAKQMRAAGVDLDPALLDSARALVSDLIADRVAGIAFGDSAVFRRDAVHDAQFQRAIRLLDASPTVQALLTAASRDEG